MIGQRYDPLPPVSEVFPYLNASPSEIPASCDPFTITTKTGFLPLRQPKISLPKPFDVVSKVVEDLPILKLDGEPGLLAKIKLGPLIDSGALPDLTSHIDGLTTSDGKLDLEVITALFRDYSFIASSYLLEPCWERWNRDHSAGYGLGRPVLPKCIAGPLVKTAQILDIPPFMSYAASYALYNYSLVDAHAGAGLYDNIRLVRAFEQGLDHKSSEAGFILTHVHMVSFTDKLIDGVVGLLSAIGSHVEPHQQAIDSAKASLHKILASMDDIEASMERMWSHSLPKDYMTYRTFIYGITSQSMFPDGVVYDGQFDNQPQFFRGESGANDSIIPLLDYICEIPMPSNPLTTILRDFKNYRPQPHRTFLAYMQSWAAELQVRRFCVHQADHEVANLYLQVLNHVRSFRWRHWLFAREYIIKRTKYPTATGGSPIITWLPNQLAAVMDMMEAVYHDSGLDQVVACDDDPQWQTTRDMMALVREQQTKLAQEVQKYCEERCV